MTPARKGTVKASHGLKQLLADDPGQLLLYATEQVQAQAHVRRLGRVLRLLRRRHTAIGWVHVSDAYNPCDRVVAARILGYQLPEDPVSPQLQRIFDNGTFMHLRWQNTFLSLPDPYRVEIAPLLRQWPLIGEADAIIDHPMFKDFVIEIKSMNTNEFKNLKNPRQDHANQINSYMGLGNCSQGVVWYENKDTQDLKIYLEKYRPEPYQEMYERLSKIALIVGEGLLPKPCGECKLDDYIGNLDGVEERVELMKSERDRWQTNTN